MGQVFHQAVLDLAADSETMKEELAAVLSYQERASGEASKFSEAWRLGVCVLVYVWVVVHLCLHVNSRLFVCLFLCLFG